MRVALRDSSDVDDIIPAPRRHFSRSPVAAAAEGEDLQDCLDRHRPKQKQQYDQTDEIGDPAERPQAPTPKSPGSVPVMVGHQAESVTYADNEDRPQRNSLYWKCEVGIDLLGPAKICS